MHQLAAYQMSVRELVKQSEPSRERTALQKERALIQLVIDDIEADRRDGADGQALIDRKISLAKTLSLPAR